MPRGVRSTKPPQVSVQRKKRASALAPVHDCDSQLHGADHSAQMNRLNRIIGQLKGVGRMIEAQRYCPDILVQTRAIVSAIRALETAILEDHLRHCVKRAFSSKDQKEADAMIQELVDLYASRD